MQNKGGSGGEINKAETTTGENPDQGAVIQTSNSKMFLL